MNAKAIKKPRKFPSVSLRKLDRSVVEGRSESSSVDKPASSDKRILFTKYFIASVFVITVVGMFTTEKSVSESFVLIATFLVLAVINYIGFYVLRNDVSGSLVFALLCLYIWVAFPLKLMVAVNDPAALWISKNIVDPDMVKAEIAGSYLSLFPALAFLFIGLFMFHWTNRAKKEYQMQKISNKLFISVIIALMGLRIFNQTILNIGVPGVEPTALPVPYLSGVLELMARPVLMALVNLYFYYVIRLNDRKAIWISLLLLLLNIVLGLRVGYKSELVLQGLLLVYYSFEVFPYLSKINRKLMMTATAGLISLILVLYPIINHYRSYLLSGMDISQAIESAQKRAEDNKESFALSFLNRVNGIGEFYAATKLGSGRDFGFSALLDNSVMDLIKEKLYGSEKNRATVAFGTTAFSVIYLVGGGIFLIVFSFIVGALIRGSVVILKYKVFRSGYTFQAYLPLLCILWVKLLASGGGMALYMKELFLVVVCLALLERYGVRSKPSGARQ